MNFLRRLICFLFGHWPGPVVISYDNGDKGIISETKDLMVIQPAPGTNPLVLNVCRVCKETCRHVEREAHWAKVVAEQTKAEIAKKAAAEAKPEAPTAPPAPPLPPSPIPFDRARTTKKLKPKKES